MSRLKAFSSVSALVLLLLLAPAETTRAASPTLDENPFAAHNAYPWRLYARDRFDSALASGLKHLEVDITWDASREAVVATHDSQASGNEPLLAELLVPLWQQWGSSPQQGYTLIFDFKSSSRELAGGLHDILKPHADLLSTMVKGSGQFQPKGITVCLTGSGACQEIYDRLIAEGDTYLAFGDHGHGDWRPDAASYVPDEPPGFYRFLTFHFDAFLESREARGPEHLSSERIRQVVDLCQQRGGWRMRIYTLNPPRKDDGSMDDQAWRTCVEGGAHMISTDAYRQSSDWWQRHVEAAQ